MRFMTLHTASRGARRGLRPATAAALLAGLAACSTDRLLSVPDPTVATPASLSSASGLPALLAGAQSSFQYAYGGANGVDGMVTLSGLFTDELFNIETFPTRIEVDTRAITDVNATTRDAYRAIQNARAAAEQAARGYARFDSTNVARSEALSLAGYAYTIIGENYCNGVPFSSLDEEGNLTFGQAQTTTEIFTAAAAKFDTALTVATASTAPAATKASRQNLARVGRARALLNLGRFADAAAAVQGVPTSFVYQIQFSENSGRQQNGVFTLASAVTRRFSGTDREGQNGLPYRSSGDARVAQVRNGTGFDNISPAFYPIKYTPSNGNGRGVPITLADGVEARLIEAEAALQANNAAGLLGGINAARAAASIPSGATPPTGTALPAQLTTAAVPADRAGQVNLLFQERAYALYLTSHRLGDMRRLVRQYQRNAETVFPTGAYASPNKATGYGADVNFPLPQEEQNNPNFSKGAVCIDRNA